VGSVVYHEHSATVKIKDPNGVTHTTNINFDESSGNWSCPSSVSDDLETKVVAIGRVKITLQGVNKYADPSRYNLLVDEYNQEVDDYNATLQSKCSN
jgi:hypothetical protein